MLCFSFCKIESIHVSTTIYKMELYIFIDMYLSLGVLKYCEINTFVLLLVVYHKNSRAMLIRAMC